MNHDSIEPLSREEVIKAVEGKNPSRVPCIRTQWWGEGLWDRYGARLNTLEQHYPSDMIEIGTGFHPKDMGLSWELPPAGAHDNAAVLDDWAKLDEFVGKIPDPRACFDPEPHRAAVEKAQRENRYLMFTIWNLFFEKPWYIRGMANLLTDYYTNPEEVHRLHAALASYYTDSIRVFSEAFHPDGFWTSDDLGHQTQLMMPPDTFREFIQPYYRNVGAALKENSMHWWLHSCGNNTDIMTDLAETGVTMFHPVQKGCMDEKETAQRMQGKMGFCAGIDVQHTLQEKSPEEVRREVRFLIDTFDRPQGFMTIAAGNGIVGTTPFENIEAFLDESVRYGIEHRRMMNTR